ncbi:hypothetical protein [Burkholderia lata]|uniref:hypothetical protein n=1 Tax=Burkholderia lata (strain ATCC 17760 / DSM 23089 / LMG 22485 / NCIMB 9086 / R18194 / 383) TaxID=482957 RepID=UPI001582609E|nr:hypothetical protein [Burkholderia lata]
MKSIASRCPHAAARSPSGMGWRRMRSADLNTSLAGARVQCRSRDYFEIFIFNSIELHFKLIDLLIGIEYPGIRKMANKKGN